MNDQVEQVEVEAATEVETNVDRDYPNTFTLADIATEEGLQEMLDVWGVTTNDLAEHRVFDNVQFKEDGTPDITDGFDIVIDFRDQGAKFSDNPGAFLFAMPSFETLMADKEGEEFCRDAVASALFRKHAASANAVNKEGGTFSPPVDVKGWITGSQSAGTGRKRVAEALFRKVQSVVASGIAKMLKAATGQSFPAKDLKAILTSASFTETAYAKIADSEGAVERIAEVVKEAMSAKAVELNEAATAEGKDLPYPDQDAVDKHLATIDSWLASREAAQEIKPQEVDFAEFSLGD